MSNEILERIETLIGDFDDPVLGRVLQGARVTVDTESPLSLRLTLGWPAAGIRESLAESVAEWLAARLDETPAVSIDWEIASHAVQGSLKPMAGVKNIIAVASGKGGVGKSTTAANLALALAAEGASAAVLDADIYGPSQPRMLGAEGRPTTRDGKTMQPLQAHGIGVMSVGFLMDPEQPMVWRGPMVTQALNQLISDTDWGDLDYLIVDMPPGTGDIQLTLAQRVPVSGAVIVTTPQEISLLDARKGLKMFQKVDVRVLGIVENMGTHVCSQCGHEDHIFGEGGGQRLAQQFDTPLLASLPLDPKIREEVDGGRPSVISDPDGAIAHRYRDMARRMARELAIQGGEAEAAFPNISVVDD
ncbi:ATP-binding protein involved in chromosome partitioning [Natronospira proteinivora]|uniref:Iron-sulfur cluster carrier protein n=1 Tax=Natronospira proteinivora TaxID=1807133 RepID=A0ABT1G4D6_9GAMM|nr:iron-sulfur cluster carrier protein ApbC [Natronospira proteinivora]MCP1726159.1 ATP-binding protein involved in chromosome partitioning [Natronospira proteinivora]